MAKYEVINPWSGVSAGDIIETETLHDSIKGQVREIKVKEKEFEVATPKRGPGRPAKE
ncbi:hypothetical protein D3C77_325860 [compost metagenome]